MQQPGWRIDREIVRRVGVTLLALAAVQAMPLIPLPGIGDLRPAVTVSAAPPLQYWQSMDALDVGPLLLAWMDCEIWRTVFSLRADGSSTGLGHWRVEWLILPLALALSAIRPTISPTAWRGPVRA